MTKAPGNYDTLLGALSAVLLFVIFGFGFSFGRSSAGTDCKRLGAFVVEGKKYECLPKSTEQAPEVQP